jgi:hypothetical protein
MISSDLHSGQIQLSSVAHATCGLHGELMPVSRLDHAGRNARPVAHEAAEQVFLSA